LLTGCSREHAAREPSPPPAPRIEKDEITFTTNAPQFAYLAIEPAQERKELASALSGRLAWDDDITARVFSPVSGRITEILANPGQRVAVGDVLLKIKSPDFGQAQADACKAIADLNAAERALKRTRELLEHGAAAQKDTDAAETDHARALSEKERALATLALYGGDGDATRRAGVDGVFLLKSPVAGVVVEKSVSPGQEVRSDQVGDKPLFVVSDPARLWLFLDVPEAGAAALQTNQEVLVRARSLPGQVFHGRIEIIGEGLDATTRTIKARCVVDNAEKHLRAEMYVTAAISGDAGGVDVPTRAVFSRNDEHYVFVETRPGQFTRRAVKLGPESDDRSMIVSGLSANERVVTDGCLLLEAMLEGPNS
jgi:cobalt-zinc-cadmium efflux system membrane fusion protein